MEDWKEIFEVSASNFGHKIRINVLLLAMVVGDQIMYKVRYENKDYLVYKRNGGRFSANAEFFDSNHTRFYLNVPYWK
ncbi:MAG: hypothetical protein K2H60_01940 [Muribaculaceae bacterium]|nr:hypothetical protein [Muribaculaceae bacterium]